MAMLDYDAFTTQVMTLLGFDGDFPLDPYDDLYSDVGLDSLQAFQLLIAIEALANVDVPPPDLPEIFTMKDAYGYYEYLHGRRQ